ncbi:unnamed protein product [Sphagnum balticum]
MEFRSDRLWSDYIEWEVAANNMSKAMAIYDRLLLVPTQMYSQHFDNVETIQLVFPVEEVQLDAEGHEVAADGTDIPIQTAYHKKVCIVFCFMHPHSLQYDDEALKLFRVAVLDKRRKMHLLNESEVSKRWNFEEGYARYLESRNEQEAAREVYKRACTIHLPKKPNPHLAWSAFEEKLHRFDDARDILAEFERRVDGLALVQLRRIGIERRRAIYEAQRIKDDPDAETGVLKGSSLGFSGALEEREFTILFRSSFANPASQLRKCGGAL